MMVQQEILRFYDPLDRASTAPQQSRLAERLMSMMRDARFETGMPLPSMRVIGEHFKVGHATVQQTLNELAAKGYIYRYHGKGCFVKRKPKFKNRMLTRRVSVPLMTIPYEDDYLRPQANIISGVSVGLGIAGWTFQCVPCQPDGSEFEEILRSFCNGATDGVLLPGLIPNIKKYLNEAKTRGMPVMIINNVFPDVASFTLSVRRACTEAYNKLRGEGAEGVVVFRGPSQNPRFLEIDETLANLLDLDLKTFRACLLKLFDPNSKRLSAISAEMVNFLRGLREKPDIIFCSPEILTLATIRALRELKWNTIRLVSVDDSLEVHHYADIEITHVKVPYFQLGKTAAETFAENLENGAPPKIKRNTVDCVLKK